MNSRKSIPNPNKLTSLEADFVKENKPQIEKIKKQNYKGRMISMSDEFYEELNNFLNSNPTEGNRSSFIVRIVAQYIKNKH